MSSVRRETTWRRRIKQSKEKQTKTKTETEEVNPNQQFSSLNLWLIFKDTVGFHYQEQLLSASCYMLRNKDNYNVGNIIFLTINILCLSNKQWIVCFLLFTTPLALILALRWFLFGMQSQGSLKIIFTATSGTIHYSSGLFLAKRELIVSSKWPQSTISAFIG